MTTAAPTVIYALVPERYTLGEEHLTLAGPLPDRFTLETRVRIEPN